MFKALMKYRRRAIFLADCTRELDEQLSGGHRVSGCLTEGAKREVREQNVAKLDLITLSDDWYSAAASHLARELDSEAQVGVFLLPPGQDLNMPFVRGGLSEHLSDAWPVLFQADAEAIGYPTTAHQERIDYLSTLYSRAEFDALISYYALMMCADEAGKTIDEAKELYTTYRSTLYAYYEVVVRKTLNISCVEDETLWEVLSATVKEIGILDYSESQWQLVEQHARHF